MRKTLIALVIEGNATSVEAGGVTSVVFGGNDNTVRYTGTAPGVDDDGTANVVTGR